MQRLKDKINECRQHLVELEGIVPASFDDYTDNKTKAACERYAERIIECLVVLAFALVKKEKLGLPRDDADAFRILADKKIVPRPLAERLVRAKGMRNVIIHSYSTVNDELVYEAVKGELPADAEEFLKAVQKSLKA